MFLGVRERGPAGVWGSDILVFPDHRMCSWGFVVDERDSVAVDDLLMASKAHGGWCGAALQHKLAGRLLYRGFLGPKGKNALCLD